MRIAFALEFVPPLYRCLGELHGVYKSVVLAALSVEDVMSRQMDVLVVHDDDCPQHDALLPRKNPRQPLRAAGNNEKSLPRTRRAVKQG